MHPLIPSRWQVPAVFEQRLGEKPGRQRLMKADGHLLLILHKTPVPGAEEREARIFWRNPQGEESDFLTPNEFLNLTVHAGTLTASERTQAQIDELLRLRDSVAPGSELARFLDGYVATHGRGIWIVDDITPLRQVNSALLQQQAAFVTGRPVQQRINADAGGALGSAVFVGDNPTNGAVITYYQKSRHLFGKLKIEILDASGKVIDELPASKRRGLNRVVWAMRMKPPRVPPDMMCRLR